MLDQNTLHRQLSDVKRLEAFWKAEASHYACRTLPPNSIYREEWAKFLLHYEQKRILEVGCNEGQNLIAIHNINPTCELYGCDIATLSTPTMIKFRNASAYNLPYPDNFADLITCHGLLMHLPPNAVRQAVSELIRVSSKYIVIREDVEILGDGSYRGEPNAIFVHDYMSLFKNMFTVYAKRETFLSRKRFTGVFKK